MMLYFFKDLGSSCHSIVLGAFCQKEAHGQGTHVSIQRLLSRTGVLKSFRVCNTQSKVCLMTKAKKSSIKALEMDGYNQKRYKWESVYCLKDGAHPVYYAICRLYTVGRTEVWQEHRHTKLEVGSCPAGMVRSRSLRNVSCLPASRLVLHHGIVTSLALESPTSAVRLHV